MGPRTCDQIFQLSAMSFAKLLRAIILGLISLFGMLILIGLAKWFHYWLYGSHNLDKGMSLDDWRLGLGIFSFVIQVSAAIEALFIGLATRLRWIKLSRGRLAIGLLSLIPLVCALSAIQSAISSEYINIWWVLLYQLIIMLPLFPAWRLLRFQRA